jgi:hypothetical protein
MTLKYTSLFYSKAKILRTKFTQIGIFGLKTNHLATLVKTLDTVSKSEKEVSKK